jgi:hypothetical protein
MDIKNAEDILFICLMAFSGGILLLPFMEKENSLVDVFSRERPAQKVIV